MTRATINWTEEDGRLSKIRFILAWLITIPSGDWSDQPTMDCMSRWIVVLLLLLHAALKLHLSGE